MKKAFIILAIIVIILIISSFFIGGQLYTPAENRFTGKCKVFSSTVIPPWYKKSNKCRTFWSIDQRLKMAESHDKNDGDYLDKIDQDKEAINKLCSGLESKQQAELFSRYYIKSCSGLTKLLK